MTVLKLALLPLVIAILLVFTFFSKMPTNVSLIAHNFHVKFYASFGLRGYWDAGIIRIKNVNERIMPFSPDLTGERS